jgi:lipopolysaccharide export system protein LptA
MRTSQAARYARWSAAVAVLLATVVSGVYARRAWQAHLTKSTMRPSVPVTVQQQTAEFSLSKVTGDRTEFTVRASHAIEFADGGRSVLQDVWFTAYGQDGQRFDNLHTRSCDYLEHTGEITCSGNVQIDLESAEDAKLHPGTPLRADPSAQVVHIDTSGVSFNRATGLATTDQPVTFHFAQGEGHAIGFRYDSDRGELRLIHSVEMTLHGVAMPGDPASADPLRISSSGMTYDREQRVIHFLGPVEAHRGVPELAAGSLDVMLDATMRAQRIIAGENPVLRDTAHGEPLSISANELSALLFPDGSLEHLTGAGNVRAEAHRADGEDHLRADHADLEMVGHTNQPLRLTSTGSVTASATRPGGIRQNLASSVLQVDFAADGKPGRARMLRATTPSGTLDWEGPAQSAGHDAAQRVHMASQHWEATFGGGNRIEELRGTGDAQFERRMGNAPPETGSSRDLLARFSADGNWSTVDQTGDVALREPDRSAHADAAHYDRLADTVDLSGSVELSDADSITTAQNATLRQATNEFHAQGRVATIELASRTSAADFAPGPARISADQLDANTATGHAIYSGSARLWQGDSVVEAAAIELDRATRVLTANGRVRAVFPQTAMATSGGQSINGKSAVRPPASQIEFWHAEAGRMTYASDDGRAHLEQSVFAHSEQGSIHSDAMDLFFSPPEPISQGPAPVPVAAKSGAGPGSPTAGGRQLVRAVGLGKVEVSQLDRRGTSSRADYIAADGKFVLSGGSPVVHDASGNSVTGRQLTLFYADDTIVVDSAEGLRTLTLHRVGK